MPRFTSLTSRATLNRRWSRVPQADREANTQAARDARWQRYLDAVPAEVTDPAERHRLADQARRADMQAMRAKQLQAQQPPAGGMLRCAGCGRTAPGTIEDPPKGWAVYTDDEDTYPAFCSPGCLFKWDQAAHEMMRDVRAMQEWGGEP